MPTLDIRNTVPLLYRIDCLAADSRKKYHIRGTSKYAGNPGRTIYKGYETKIEDCETDTDIYNIGHNPRTTRPENPIICDKLIIDGYYEGFDLFYDELRFERPAFTAYIREQEDHTLAVRNPDFLLVDVLTANASSGIHVAGRYYNGSSYSDFSRDHLSTPDYFPTSSLVPSYSYRAGDVFKIGIGYSWYFMRAEDSVSSFVLTYAELTSMLRFYGDISQYREMLDVLSTYSSGVLLVPRLAIDCLLFRGGNIYLYLPNIQYPSDYSWYAFYIVPFTNDIEYHAAKAALYHWD